MNLVKILNQDKANELSNLGFKYTTETLDKELIYVFIQTNELVEKLNQTFSKKDYFIERRMNF